MVARGISDWPLGGGKYVVTFCEYKLKSQEGQERYVKLRDVKFRPEEFLTAERAEGEFGIPKFCSTEGAERGCNERAIGTDAVDNDDYGSGDEPGEFGRGGRKAEQIVGRLAQGDTNLLEDF